jgi:hypothetical protein
LSLKIILMLCKFEMEIVIMPQYWTY